MTVIRLIVGLGNPGQGYDRTRHNAGFWLLDRLALLHRGAWETTEKFHAEVARVDISGQALWLLKPMTYMNLSGQAVLSVANFYKIRPGQILVVHDELALLPGTARFKQGGSNGGHNGLKDISTCLGSQDFWRLRLGIGHPGDRNQVAQFVLSKPSVDEERALEQAMKLALQQLPSAVCGKMPEAMKELHTTEKSRH